MHPGRARPRAGSPAPRVTGTRRTPCRPARWTAPARSPGRPRAPAAPPRSRPQAPRRRSLYASFDPADADPEREAPGDLDRLARGMAFREQLLPVGVGESTGHRHTTIVLHHRMQQRRPRQRPEAVIGERMAVQVVDE